jgi:hypothetical protein
VSEAPQTGPNIKELALRIAQETRHIERFGQQNPPDFEAEARWYVAWHMADEMRDCYGTKDLAYYTLNGMEPLTDEDVRERFYDEDEKKMNWPSAEELVKWFGG